MVWVWSLLGIAMAAVFLYHLSTLEPSDTVDRDRLRRWRAARGTGKMETEDEAAGGSDDRAS